MKIVSVIICSILISGAVSAQEFTGKVKPDFPSIKDRTNSSISGEKPKFATFGFDIGVNRSNLQFGETQTDGDQITNGLGYRLGIVSNFQFTRRFSFSPKAELSFNATRLDQSNTSYNVNGTNLEFLGHFKYKLMKSNFSPYVIAGPNLRVPLYKDTDKYVPTKEDVAIDFGAGLDIPLKAFKLSPELRYSYGLSNITESSEFSDLQYHNISLSLIFTGM